MLKKLLPSLLLAAFSISVQAQETLDNAALYREIYAMDSLLFTAFNHHDLETMGQIFSEDLEFYHDKTGLTDYEQNMALLKKAFSDGLSPQRELIKSSMEVYPSPGYGAIQVAEHRFCHPENGKMECATFKFVHIWQYDSGKWKLTRVVSFDH